MRAYDVVQLDEITRSDGWAPIRRELDVQSFGINAWTAATGDTLIPEHDEVPTGHEELYLVTAGRATFTVQGEVTEAGPGTVVLVRDPAARRGAVAAAAATTVVSVGGRPGEVYAPQAWEVNADLLPLFDRGEFGEAKRVVSAALEEYGPSGILLYNLACAEAQLGEADAALDHLAAALADRPDLAAAARDDSDLEPLRAHPRFAGITG